VERREQKGFDCNTLKPTAIPGSAQDHVLSLLPKREPGETDFGYRERLPSAMHKGIYDWWVNETSDAKRFTVYCEA
jgi:hypothetical protein